MMMNHNRPPTTLVTTLLVVVALLGTTTTPPFAAAAGDCPEQPGSVPSTVYLPSCHNVLRRELWRVFKKNDTGLAYMIPRPDGAGLKYNLCKTSPRSSDEHLALVASVQKYGLCNKTVTEPSVMNEMDPDEALAIADALHQRLEFRVKGGRLDPWVPNGDRLDACAILRSSTDAKAAQRQDDAESYCQRLAEIAASFNDVGLEPSRQSLKALLPALNELYGVDERNASSSAGAWWGAPRMGNLLVGLAAALAMVLG